MRFSITSSFTMLEGTSWKEGVAFRGCGNEGVALYLPCLVYETCLDFGRSCTYSSHKNCVSLETLQQTPHPPHDGITVTSGQTIVRGDLLVQHPTPQNTHAEPPAPMPSNLCPCRATFAHAEQPVPMLSNMYTCLATCAHAEQHMPMPCNICTC